MATGRRAQHAGNGTSVARGTWAGAEKRETRSRTVGDPDRRSRAPPAHEIAFLPE